MGGSSNGPGRPGIARILSEAAESLVAIGAGNPRFEAELLLSLAIGKSRVYLFTHPNQTISSAESARFSVLLSRRLESQPLQYVMGSAQFRDLELTVRPGVLIPRPETELLVDFAWQALERQRERFAAAGRVGAKPWLIDVGVGSGAIVLALMNEARGAGARANASSSSSSSSPSAADCWFRPLGIDLLPIPLTVTGENAAASGLPRPDLARSDFLDAISPEAPVAGIVSNPPYVSASEMAALPVEIFEHEPHEALFGGQDGMSAIRILLDQAAPFVARGAFFCCEIGGAQADLVGAELERRDLAQISDILPDLAGRPRVVLIEPDRDPLLP